MGKTCCVTGHRNIPPQHIEGIKQKLKTAIQQALSHGCTHFISGFAQGTDLLFASIVLQMQATNPSITLEAALPYQNRTQSKNPLFHNLLLQCQKVTILHTNYTPSCFMDRNRYMVDHSDYLIAVYDGRKTGGTWNTLCYAQKRCASEHIASFSSHTEGFCVIGYPLDSLCFPS